MKLDTESFLGVIRSAPLIAIDMIVRNERGQFLLGRRRNRPAQGFWFVPGGRIRKNESLRQGLQRIAQSELGTTAIGPGKLLGAYDHFYEDNFFGIDGIRTHYVALACEFAISGETQFHPDEQHAELKWWTLDELLGSGEVHDNTKMYFRDTPDNGFRAD